MASCIIDGFICGYNIAALKSTKSHCVVIFKRLGWKNSFWLPILCPPWSSFWTLQEYFFFPQNNLYLYECMYETVKGISTSRQIYICSLHESQYKFFFSIFGTTLWDYINKKTGEGQRSLSISIYPDEQLPVNSRDGDCTIFHQPGCQTNTVHMLVGISRWILKRMLFLIKAVFLTSILKPNSWALSHHNNSYLATLISVQAPFSLCFYRAVV